MIKNEELFTKDTYENYMMDFKKRPTVVKALCLHIAHDCNLACRYCFAEEGEYHGRRALMSFETGKKALDFLIANSGNRRNLEVDFFGGEPLMNWQVVKDLVAYGREQEKIHNKNFRFTLTTNGVLLNDEIMEFANKEMGNVVLSIDGRKEVHDHMRPFRKGAGSYDLIVPKFQKFAESRNQDKYYVRGTFTHNNLDFSNDVLHLADLGFKQISVEPVVAQPTEDYAIREEDLPQLYEQYLSAVDALKDRGLSVITHLILGLPGETKEMMLASVDAVAHLPVDGVKLQLLHVLKNTDLALLYEKAPFPVFSLEEYCDFVVTSIEHLPPEMVIHRLTGDGPRSLLIAPLWSTDKKRVLNTIRKRFQERDTWQGKYYTDQA